MFFYSHSYASIQLTPKVFMVRRNSQLRTIINDIIRYLRAGGILQNLLTPNVGFDVFKVNMSQLEPRNFSILKPRTTENFVAREYLGPFTLTFTSFYGSLG